MSNSPADPEPQADEPGVFGSLPRTRPTVRSPGRSSAPRARSPEPAPAQERAAEAAAAPADLEQLAKAGVTAASQAAAIGLRLAGRAAGALREAVERR